MSNTKIQITVIRSRRRTMELQIKDGRVVVRAPLGMSDKTIERFVESKKEWIAKHLSHMQYQERSALQKGRLSDAEIDVLKKQAENVISERVAYYAPLVGVTYGNVSIRCQKTRWGSCSSKGNLNFNCLLMLAPAEVLDSVVVHELCHRKEMNHSPRFYREVYRVYPEYDRWNRWLKLNGVELLKRAAAH